jgi:hypothetical protein
VQVIAEVGASETRHNRETRRVDRVHGGPRCRLMKSGGLAAAASLSVGGSVAGHRFPAEVRVPWMVARRHEPRLCRSETRGRHRSRTRGYAELKTAEPVAPNGFRPEIGTIVGSA